MFYNPLLVQLFNKKKKIVSKIVVVNSKIEFHALVSTNWILMDDEFISCDAKNDFTKINQSLCDLILNVSHKVCFIILMLKYK